MRPSRALTTFLGAKQSLAHCCSGPQSSSFANTSIAQLSNAQNLSGPAFLGHESTNDSLSPKFVFDPPLTCMHQDGGNSGSTNYRGPTGRNTSVHSYAADYRVMLWGSDGSLTAGATTTANGTTKFSLLVVDPATMEVRGSWTPDTPEEVLNLAYMSLHQDTNAIAVSGKQGVIYVLQRNAENFTLIETYNLTNTMKPWELLLNSVFDAEGNIWFTTGTILVQEGFPDAPGDMEINSTTLGYIEPKTGTVHSIRFAGQVVENGIAVSGTTVFCVTGPVGTNSTGYLFSFSPASPGCENITVNWKAPYDAGTRRKPGAWARGSGSTPGLLGNQYVAITDNSDSQLHLLVFAQSGEGGGPKSICSVPVFPPGEGNNDVGLLIHHDAVKDNSQIGTFGVALFNNYNATPLFSQITDKINSADWNNLTNIVAETVRVDIAENGSSCHIAWDVPVRIPSVPVLSTSTGLLYGYTQDAELTLEPEPLWEFYMTAVDWETGEEVFRVRTGAGGTLNDNYLPGTLAPDGSFFQGVSTGLVRVKDGEC